MMYPSIQANIWGNIGKVTDLLDTVLDSFIKVCHLFKGAMSQRFCCFGDNFSLKLLLSGFTYAQNVPGKL